MGRKLFTGQKLIGGPLGFSCTSSFMGKLRFMQILSRQRTIGYSIMLRNLCMFKIYIFLFFPLTAFLPLFFHFTYLVSLSLWKFFFLLYSFPDDVEISGHAKDLIKKLLSNPKNRLGVNGVEEIKEHLFFVNDDWTFDTIRKCRVNYSLF